MTINIVVRFRQIKESSNWMNFDCVKYNKLVTILAILLNHLQLITPIFFSRC